MFCCYCCNMIEKENKFYSKKKLLFLKSGKILIKHENHQNFNNNISGRTSFNLNSFKNNHIFCKTERKLKSIFKDDDKKIKNLIKEKEYVNKNLGEKSLKKKN